MNITISDPGLLRWYGFSGSQPVELPHTVWAAMWRTRYFAEKEEQCRRK